MHLVEPRGAPRGVLVVAHGLNQHAFGLRSLFEPLAAEGHTIVVLELRGHGREPNAPPPDARAVWPEVTVDDWAADWTEAATVAGEMARRLGVPLAFLGYSMGALVHVHQMGTRASLPATFARQVLLAPAIRVRSRTHAVRLFRLLGPRFLVPSFAPARIRAQDTTSVAAYEALFTMEATIDRLPYPERLQLPTTVITDPGDELVSVPRMQALVRQYGLEDHWTFEAVTKDRATAQTRLRHYITDPAGLGTAAFDRLLARVREGLFA